MACAHYGEVRPRALHQDHIWQKRVFFLTWTPWRAMGQIMNDHSRMRVVIYSAQQFERTAFLSVVDQIPAEELKLDLRFVQASLNPMTAPLARGARALCLFVRDRADAPMLRVLRSYGVELLALRYAGRATVDLEKAFELGLRVARVPTHAPGSIAEYAITLMLALNRKVHIAANRVRNGDPSLHGLLGFDLADKTVGVLGTGLVGRRVIRLLRAFGCTVLAYDAARSPEVSAAGATYVPVQDLFRRSDILTLHAPLVPSTRHIIGHDSIRLCKRGVHIINTARGALIDSAAVVEGLRSGAIGALGIDVFEGEADLFFMDNTGMVVDSDFQMLKSMPNVIVTGHQGTLTTGALASVARATIHTLGQFHDGEETLDFEIARDPVI